MADGRIQELLRELRERWGVKVVPEPPPEVLAWLRKAERYISSSPPPWELAPWLASLSLEAGSELCLKRGPSGAVCDLQFQHKEQHSSRVRSGAIKWPGSGRRQQYAYGTCEAGYDSGRLRCALPSGHNECHEYEEWGMQ